MGGLNQHRSSWRTSRLGIQPLFGDEPTFSPRKTAGRASSSFVQIDQSGIRLPRLSRRNNYINYLCFALSIHFTFFTWYLLRPLSGMFTYYRNQPTSWLNKTMICCRARERRESIRYKSTNYNLYINTSKATYKNLNIFKRLNLLDECKRIAKVKSLKTGKM